MSANEASATPVSLALLVCSVPAASMFLGSVLAFAVLTGENKKVLAITQYFSAGILIAAIGVELIPKLIETGTGFVGSLTVAMGFFSGVGVMLGLEKIKPEDVMEEGMGMDSKARGLLAGAHEDDVTKQNSRERWKSATIKIMALRQLITKSTKSASYTAATLQRKVERIASGAPIEAINWKSAFPIYVDSLVDGVLIGIVLAASLHAGSIMALATTFEMGFLGITFGAMLKSCGSKKWPAAALAPLILVASGVAGNTFADALAAHPAVFSGIVAFGTSALLFLVTHELLNEAKENMSEEEDWSIWLFIGFFFIVLSERALG